MSVLVSALIWQFSKATGSTLLTALALADRSDDDGNSYPGVAALAKKARVSERSVQYALRELQSFGELIVRIGEGPRGCNRYQLQVQNLRGANSAPGVQPSVERGEPGCTQYIRDTSIKKEKGIRARAASKPPAATPEPLPPLPEWMPAEAWAAWVEMRRVKKSPVSKSIAALAIKTLQKLERQGHDPGDVLNQSTLSEWTGLFAVKGAFKPPPSGESPSQRRARERHAQMSGGLVSAKPPDAPELIVRPLERIDG